MTGISNARLGMMLVVGTETLLFSSFIGAYIILRAAAAAWPPYGIPHLTLVLSTINTALLLASSFFATRIGHPSPLSPLPSARGEGGGEGSAYLLIVLAMGLLFLALQGLEFHRLYTRGLTLQTGTYGALFYTLITCHGLHVLGGLAILGVAYIKSSTPSPLEGEGPDEGELVPSPRPSPSRGEGIEWINNAGLYWHFVTGVWLVLFAVLYIV